ncbi:MAG: hypothetical protein AAGJ93_14505, partial [Bacteroidota bacterium]
MAILFGTTSKHKNASLQQFEAMKVRAGAEQYFFQAGKWQAGLGITDWDERQAAGSGYHQTDEGLLLVAGTPLDDQLNLLSPERVWKCFEQDGIEALT